MGLNVLESCDDLTVQYIRGVGGGVGGAIIHWVSEWD